ncbi:MAG: tRNA pseudouridine(55) synthase TruB [Gemmatimonadaceae bacterium]|nr:tRNA pseudouridine(55) synthase TruB [Gemmatimonadaceae bacterium]
MLFVDKPAGISSHDVVSTVRRAARTRRVGHAGTLDPFATGLLVVAVGACTRLLPYVAGEPKVYDALVQFGSETDTDDATGRVVRCAAPPPPAAVAAAMSALTGTFDQVPPVFSAKHVDGQRAYAVARRGGNVDLAPVPVTVHRWETLEQQLACIRVRITCAGGTYVRALARDLGRALQSAAHCAELRRVASGPSLVTEAVRFDALTPGAIADGTIGLRSPLGLLEPMAHEPLDEAALLALSHGRAVPAHHPGPRAALLSGGQVVGIADRVVDPVLGDRWQPRVVLQGVDA